MKKCAPATKRNREAIGKVLERELPARGTVLEIASGSGEHALYFAQRFAGLIWQPSDPDPDALASIIAWSGEYRGDNLRAPLTLDAARPESWPIGRVDAIVCINMVHISPWEASEGLLAGAATRLCDNGSDSSRPDSAPLIVYGPFLEDGVETAPSNRQFDESLRSRNPAWGIRRAEDLDRLAMEQAMVRTARHPMPANNLMLVYRKLAGSAS